MKVTLNQPPVVPQTGAATPSRASATPPKTREADAASVHSVRQPADDDVSLESAKGFARDIVAFVQGDPSSAFRAHGGLDPARLMALLA